MELMWMKKQLLTGFCKPGEKLKLYTSFSKHQDIDMVKWGGNAISQKKCPEKVYGVF